MLPTSYVLLPTSYLVLTVKKLEKCLSAGRSALSCSTKWKPVVSMPVNALDEPPCFCRKALNAPSSGKLSVPRNQYVVPRHAALLLE